MVYSERERLALHSENHCVPIHRMLYVNNDLEAYSCMTSSETSPIQTYIPLVYNLVVLFLFFFFFLLSVLLNLLLRQGG
jgi:hypothetical protein